MSKRLKIYITGFVIIIGLMMYMEYTKPKPINWTLTYSTQDKIPFGAYVIGKELPKLFPDKVVQLVKETPFSFLSNYHKDNSIYFLLSQNTMLSEADERALLSFVEKGNDVFIAADNVSQLISDSLRLEVELNHYIKKGSLEVYLVNPVFHQKKYKYSRIGNYSYFKQFPDSTTIVLGESEKEGNKKTNFIKVKYKKGYFYLHLFPEAYSNYFMLNDQTYEYAVHSLNYISKKTVLWDENGKSIQRSSDNLLKHIFNSPPLHWAWVMLLVGGVIYCLFFGKRTQRVIPIITPLKNTTLEFTRTIGNLYYNRKNPQNLIQKKITYFLYFVKEHYFLGIENIDDEFSVKLNLKSGVPREITDKIVFLIIENKKGKLNTEKDLLEVNTIIDLFYKKTK